jgi:hypothetical protein
MLIGTIGAPLDDYFWGNILEKKKLNFFYKNV